MQEKLGKSQFHIRQHVLESKIGTGSNGFHDNMTFCTRKKEHGKIELPGLDPHFSIFRNHGQNHHFKDLPEVQEETHLLLQ